MADTRHLTAKDGDVLVMVGTTKGAFVLQSNGARARWTLAGPYCKGEQIYAMALDARGQRPRLWAGGVSDHWGPVLHSSDDFGRTWANPEKAPIKFPNGLDASVKRIWQLHVGGADEPGRMLAGVEPAALFESRDAGESWSLVRGLWDHPHRAQWQPGGGGLCLHTILVHPKHRERLMIAVSTGGVYQSEDGGRSWRASNKGVRAEFLPNKHPEFGQCVHKVTFHPGNPRRLFLQNHWGLYRSDDGGDTWHDIANGVPSDFGFAMAMHPHDEQTVYIVPIESDAFRCTPEGKLRVYRTRDAGGSWEPLTRGLPQKDALETILRDGMATDVLNPAGIYFGTRSGSVYGSPDGGANWSQIQAGLPPIVCVKTAVIGGADKARVPASRGSAAKPARAKSSGPKRAARSSGSQAAGKKRAAKTAGRKDRSATRRPARAGAKGSARKAARRS